MKSVAILALTIAVLFTAAPPADAFISSLISTVTNVVVSTVETVTNVVVSTVETVTNVVTTTVDVVVAVSGFVWDNVLEPTIDVFVDNSLDIIDTYFGGFLNFIGKRDASEVALATTQKKMFRQIFKASALSLKSAIHHEVSSIFSEYAQRLEANPKKLTQLSAKNILIHSIRKAQNNIKEHASKISAAFASKTQSLGHESLTKGLVQNLFSLATQVHNLLNGFIAELGNVNLLG